MISGKKKATTILGMLNGSLKINPQANDTPTPSTITQKAAALDVLLDRRPKRPTKVLGMVQGNAVENTKGMMASTPLKIT